jgi:hypothetical protein
MLLKESLQDMVIKTLKNSSVPEEKDCIFTLPDFKSWPSLLRDNKGPLSAVNNRNISQTELVNTAAEYTERIGLSVSRLTSAADIIATGHQPKWHHCGIFAKNVITGGFAGQTGGVAVHLVLDHDSCSTSMSLPESDNEGLLRFKTIPLAKKHREMPLELMSVPSEEQLMKFMDSVSRTGDSICREIWCRDIHGIIANSRSCRSAADVITQLQAQLNRSLGLEIMYLPVSLMSQSSCFIAFVYSVLRDAVGFVRIYNEAIRNKIATDNLKSNQTIRSLKIDYLNGIIELPFWLVSKTGKRASLYASLNDRNVSIGTAVDIAGTIDSSGEKERQMLEILRKNKYMVRPKSVTLTLFARLYLADLFVHGTGAVNYEYITDRLIGDFYKIKNLNFGVATATMTLPASADYREFFFGLFPKERLEGLIRPQRGGK